MTGTDSRRDLLRVDVNGPAATSRRIADRLAVEEPLEIRVRHHGDGVGRPITVTMRTPGDDIDLALGFLATEGVITGPDDVRTVRICDRNRPGDRRGHHHVTGARRDGRNVVEVSLAPGISPPQTDPTRHSPTTSSCGLRGTAGVDAVRTRSIFDAAADPSTVSARTLAELPARLAEVQRGFRRTGGLHAAGLFTADGVLIRLNEDVGRHNAVDKVIGWTTRADRLPLAGHVLLVSGRASSELVQKAAMAGIPVLAAVSAPSSLAAELADETGVTLVGFLRGRTMNVYAHAERVRVNDSGR